MVKIPTLNGPGVRRAAIDSSYERKREASVSADSFGALEAQADKGLAKSIGGAAKELFLYTKKKKRDDEYAKKMKREDDQKIVQEGLLKLNEYSKNNINDLREMKEQKAAEFHTNFETQFDERQSKISEKMDDEQKNQFASQAIQTREKYDLQVRSTFALIRKNDLSESKGRLIDEYVLEAGETTLADAELLEGEGRIRLLVMEKNEGKPPKEIVAQTVKALSQFYKSSIEGDAVREPEIAYERFSRIKERLAGVDLEKMEDNLKDAVQRRASLVATRNIFDENPKRKDGLRKLGEIKDFDVRNLARIRLNERYDLRERSDYEAEKSLRGQAWDIVHKTGSTETVTGKMFASLDTRAIDKLEKTAKLVLNKKDIQTDPKVYETLVNTSLNDADAFKDLNISEFTGDLSKEDRGFIQRLQKSISEDGSEVKLAQLRSRKNYIDHFVQSRNWSEAKAVAAFKYVNNQISQSEEKEDRTLTDREQRKILLAYVVDVARQSS